jgi:hypothetical protein
VNSYFECNFSPSGDWNIYSFGSYRDEMAPVRLVADPRIVIGKTTKIFSLCAEVDLAGVITDTVPIDIGVSCVVESLGGTFGYWALSHPGEKPDFHDQRSFLKKL